jgi:hypothetical protein
MAMARITDAEIDKIVQLLTSWTGKLSWDLLRQRVNVLLGRTFTRQGLDKQEIISTAFQQAKDRLRGRPKTSEAKEDGVSPELAAARRRIDNLVAEIEVFKSERDRFLEKFATWLYNARSRGISEFDLNTPLPAVDRDSSESKR